MGSQRVGHNWATNNLLLVTVIIRWGWLKPSYLNHPGGRAAPGILATSHKHRLRPRQECVGIHPVHLPMDTDGETEAQRLPCSRLQSLAEAGLKRGLSLLFKLGVGLFAPCSTPLPAHIPTSWNPVWTLGVTVSSFPESHSRCVMQSLVWGLGVGRAGGEKVRACGVWAPESQARGRQSPPSLAIRSVRPALGDPGTRDPREGRLCGTEAAAIRRRRAAGTHLEAPPRRWWRPTPGPAPWQSWRPPRWCRW